MRRLLSAITLFLFALAATSTTSATTITTTSTITTTTAAAAQLPLSDQTVRSPTALLVIDGSSADEISLTAYLQKRLSSAQPLAAAELTRHIDSNWQLYTQQKQAISPAGSPHWYRLNLYNRSKETQYLTLSITPLRLRAATIFLHHPQAIESLPKASTVYDRQHSHTANIYHNIAVDAEEHLTVTLELLADSHLTPSFSLHRNNAAQALRQSDQRAWRLVGGIFIGMLFYILSTALITRQSGLLWLLFYSIASVCLAPTFLAHNLPNLGFSADQINKLSVSLGTASGIAFVGILKYIFQRPRYLQKISNRQIVTAIMLCCVVCSTIPLVAADIVMRLVILTTVFFSVYCAATNYYRNDQPLISSAIGPLKFALYFTVYWVLLQSEKGLINDRQLEIWLAITVIFESAMINIILFNVFRYRREVQLRHSIATAKKEQNVATLSPFLAASHHALRQPLVDIIGLCEMAMDSPLDQQQRKHLLEAQRSSRLTLNNISAIFSFQGESHETADSSEAFCLHTLLSECAQFYSRHSAELNKEVIISIDDDTADYWLANQEKIRQIIMHLLAHFLSQAQHNELYIAPRNSGDSALRITFSMLSPRGRPQEPDESSDFISDVISDDLEVAKSIIQMAGGRCISAAIDEVVTFDIVLPATPQNQTTEAPPNIDLLKHKRIIVIDDSQTSCEVISSYLARWRIESFVANSITEAQATIRHQADMEKPIDLALIDPMMPPHHDLQALQKLHGEISDSIDIAIIIMINAAPFPDSIAVKNYGVNRILTKPVLAQTLKQALLEEFHFLRALGEGATEEGATEKDGPK